MGAWVIENLALQPLIFTKTQGGQWAGLSALSPTWLVKYGGRYEEGWLKRLSQQGDSEGRGLERAELGTRIRTGKENNVSGLGILTASQEPQHTFVPTLGDLSGGMAMKQESKSKGWFQQPFSWAMHHFYHRFKALKWENRTKILFIMPFCYGLYGYDWYLTWGLWVPVHADWNESPHAITCSAKTMNAPTHEILFTIASNNPHYFLWWIRLITDWFSDRGCQESIQVSPCGPVSQWLAHPMHSQQTSVYPRIWFHSFHRALDHRWERRQLQL